MSRLIRLLLGVIAVFPASFLLVAVAGELAPDRAPTMSEKSPQTLWQFLAAFPDSLEAQIFMALVIAGSIGMLAHYLVKWARDEIKGSLLAYFVNNPKTTALSFFSYVGVAIGAIAGGAFIGDYGVFVGWKIVFWTGVTNGFTIDAIVNKTERSRWSPVERKVKKGDIEP